jgi:DNA-binding transcriptional MerR regulator
MSILRLFPAGKFAKLARTTNKTLHYYDTIGVLTPTVRGKNNYRYYSIEQLSTINLIHILQSLGMTLDEIKDMKNQRSPEFINNLLFHQIGKVDKKIEEWVRARKLLLTFHDAIQSVSNIDEATITIQFLPSKAIILGPLNDYSCDRNSYNALLDFYHVMQNQYPDLDLNYPVWGMFSEKRILQKDWKYPDRYYFYNPDGYDKRPAELYAIGYTRGGYGQTDELYRRLLNYIDDNDFEICGNTYEEYPLNELSISDDNNYLIRVMITVRKKTYTTTNNVMI